MSETCIITGMPQAVPNIVKKVIRFTFTTVEGNIFSFEAPFGVAGQVAAGLGMALRVLRTALSSQNAVEPVAAEPIQQVHIQKAFLTDDVIVQLTTHSGIPFSFQIPSQSAEEIADRLKTEAQKKFPEGLA